MKQNTHAIKVEVWAADGTNVLTFEVNVAREDIYLPGYEVPGTRHVIDALKKSSLG